MVLEQQSKKRLIMGSANQYNVPIPPPLPPPQPMSFENNTPAAVQMFDQGQFVPYSTTDCNGCSNTPPGPSSASVGLAHTDSVFHFSTFGTGDSAALQNFDFDSFLESHETDMVNYGMNGAHGFDSTLEMKASGFSLMTHEELVHHLISLQTFNGSWELSESLLEILQVNGETLFDVASKAHVDVGTFISAVVVAVFEKKLQEFEGSWELVIAKAKAWLSEQDCDLENVIMSAGVLVT